MQRTCFCVLLLLVLAFATPGFTQTGNGAPNGAHYNLNIIGVENPKTDPLTGSDRHTIFVALGNKNSAVTSKIYLTQGDFQVCDGNAFDAAYDCSGNQIQSQALYFSCPAIRTFPRILPAPPERCRRPMRSGLALLASRAD